MSLSVNKKVYRSGVGMMVINSKKKIFVAERHDFLGAWQMPQGGVEKNEDLLNAALRELEEETSIIKKDVKVLDEIPNWLYYDLPQDLINVLWNGKYVGQKQKWFLFQFLGNDEDIDVKTNNPEFLRWKWSDKNELLLKIVEFKRDIYKKVVKSFSSHLN